MSETNDLWMVGDVLDAMSGNGGGLGMPESVTAAMSEVQEWLSGALADFDQTDLLDVATGGTDRGYWGDLDYLFSRLERVSPYIDIVPAFKEVHGTEDAIVLSVGPIVLDEGMRMIVDHAALFAAGRVKRVWLLSDTWLMGDLLSYLPHIRALRERGVEIRFFLMTPWGCSEIPWSRVG